MTKDEMAQWWNERNIECLREFIDEDTVVIGLDVSLNGTGVCVLDQEANIIQKFRVKQSSGKSLTSRLANLRDVLLEVFGMHGKFILMVEDINSRAMFNGIRAVAQAHGALHMAMHEHMDGGGEIFFARVGVTSLKKGWTGNGRADKEDMKAKAVEVFGVEFDTDDEADAAAVACVALHALGLVVHDRPEMTTTAFDTFKVRNIIRETSHVTYRANEKLFKTARGK